MPQPSPISNAGSAENTARSDGLRRPARPWRARLLAGLVAPCLLALTVWQVVGGYHKQLADTETLVTALARVSEEHISGVMRSIDLVLAEAIEQGAGDDGPEVGVFNALLTARVKNIPEARSAFVTDAKGVMRAGTLEGMVGTDVHDREYFTALAGNPDLDIAISAPLRSRIRPVVSIVIARPMRRPDGSLAGIAAVAVDPKIFEDELRTVLPGHGGRATLIRRDGLILARLPDSEMWRGKSVAAGEVISRMHTASSGAIQGISVTDGGERIVAYRGFRQHPLVVAVGMPTAEVLGRWRADAMLQGGASLLLVLVTFGLAMVSDQRLAERQRAQQELAASDARYRQLTEHSPVGVFQSDKDGVCLYVNERWLDLAGCRRSDILGGKWCDVVHPDDREVVRQAWTRHLDGAAEFLAEMRLIRPDGAIRWVRGHVSALSEVDGPAGGMVGTIEDISAAKAMEARTLALVAKLDASNQELEQFAYVTSHDLQEPLRMIAGYAQLIDRRYRGRLDSDADEFLAFLVDGARRMQAMIQDLLEYSRVERRGGQFTAFEAGDALEHVLLNLGAAITEAGGTVEIGPLPAVTADRSQFVRLFQNLIGNALKYRSPDRPPRVAVTTGRREANWLFSVADNGIGIEPEYFDRIFQVFQRLHTRDKYDGTGIGLAICKKIVERHGGRIWVESVPGQGCTFHFTLPATSA